MKRLSAALTSLATLNKLPTPIVEVLWDKNVERFILNGTVLLCEKTHAYASSNGELLVKDPAIILRNRVLTTKYKFNITHWENVVYGMTIPTERFIRTYKSQYTSNGSIPEAKDMRDINYNIGLVKWVNTYTLSVKYSMRDDALQLIIAKALLKKPALISHIQVDVVYVPNAIKVLSITGELFDAIKNRLEYKGWNPLKTTVGLNEKFSKGLK